MSISKIEPSSLTPGQALGFVAGASALGALIAYLAAKNVHSGDDSSPKKVSVRDRSEGKKVGKQVNLLGRRQTKVIEADEIEELEDSKQQQSIQELLSIELKRHKSQQKKYECVLC